MTQFRKQQAYGVYSYGYGYIHGYRYRHKYRDSSDTIETKRVESL